MKKSYIAIGIIILLLVAFALFPSNEALIEVKSDDGLATLTIDEDSLPKGVNIADLEIKKMTDPDENILAGYELLPDGTEFSKAASFEFSFDEVSNIAPIVIHQSGDEIDIVDNISIVVDGPQNKTTITAPIEHFSTVHAEWGLFEFTISDIGDQFVDVPFEFAVTAEQKLDARARMGPSSAFPRTMADGRIVNYSEYRTVPNDWSMNATATTTGYLVPVEIKNFPARYNIDGPKYESSREFTCYEASPHNISIYYHPTVFFRVDIELYYADGTMEVFESGYRRMSSTYIMPDRFRCINRTYEEVRGFEKVNSIDGLDGDWYLQTDEEENDGSSIFFQLGE